MLCDGYVEDQEVKVNGSAIMQNYENNEKKTIKNYRLSTISDFIYANFFMGYPCVIPYILVYIHGPALFNFLF